MISCRVSSLASPQVAESTNFEAVGPRMIPMTVAGRASPRYQEYLIFEEIIP